MLYREVLRRHADEVDELEQKRAQELKDEEERHSREKRTLEADINILHKNLDTENRIT